MTAFPLVGIVIVNWNGYKDTTECLLSLEDISYAEKVIYLINNGSLDNSLELLKDDIEVKGKYRNTIKICAVQRNCGFAGGNNIGIAMALNDGCKYICLLNNDTIVNPYFLTRLVKTIVENENIGIAGGVIREYTNHSRIWFCGGYLKKYSTKGIHAIHQKKISIAKEVVQTSFITGCLQLINANVFKKIGYLDERYFMYYEDVDFCQRATESGFTLVVNQSATIYHKCGASASYASPTSIYYSNRSKYLFIILHTNGINRFLLLFQFKILLIIKYIIYSGVKRKAIAKVKSYINRR